MLIMYTVNRDALLPYIYYVKGDILLRTSKPIKYGCDSEKEGLVGCYLLFILMRHYKLLSVERILDIEDTLRSEIRNYKCGWQSIIKGEFSGRLQPQRKEPSARPRSPLDTPVCQKTIELLKEKRLKYMDEL